MYIHEKASKAAPPPNPGMPEREALTPEQLEREHRIRPAVNAACAPFGLCLLICVAVFAGGCMTAENEQAVYRDVAVAANDDATFPTATQTYEPVFREPPRLAITQSEFEIKQQRPGFEERRQGVLRAADILIDEPLPIPRGYAQWIFYYACEDDGSTLRAIDLEHHECPSCGKVYTDQRTIAAYRCYQHHDIERGVESLGRAYLYSGDDRYAAEVRRLLTALADQYPDYPSRLDRWGRRGFLARLGGRRYVQSLDEAVGVIRLAKGYDLTRNSDIWSDADRKHVEDNLFALTAETLLRFNQGINNHQTWYNAGLMAIASVLADADLVDRVMRMRGGFDYQLERSIGKDGLWYEGTMAYHSYALQAMIAIVDAGRRMGLPLHERARFRAMLRAPLKIAYPNGQFPAFNDSDIMHVDAFRQFWLWAWHTTGDSWYAQAYAHKRPERLRQLLGEDARPLNVIAGESMVLAGNGIAILRRGKGVDASVAMLTFGPHGGGHGHYDKLNIVLYAMNREWLLDPGRLTYSHAEHRTWSRHTAAHNTVTIGGRSQQAAEGKVLWMIREPDFDACAAETDAAYPGVTLRRYLLLTEEMLVDVFDVDNSSKSQTDWLVHAVAKNVRPVSEMPSPADASPGTRDGYQRFSDGLEYAAPPDSVWEFIDENQRRLRLWFAGDSPESVFTANGIGYWLHQRTPTLIRRRNATQTRFVTVYDLSGTGDFVQEAAAFPASRDKPVIIETSKGSWKISFEPEAPQISFEP